MSSSSRKFGILVFLVLMIAAFAVVASGCSVKAAIVGSTTTAGPSVSTTAASGTETTKIVEGGKTAEQYAAEVPDLQKAVDAAPTDLAALQALAVAQYNSNDYDGATGTYLKMLQISDDPMTRNNYANVLRDAGKKDEAKAEYLKAITADPTLTVAYLNLSVMYAAEKNITEANKILDQGIAALPADDQKRLKTYKESLNATTTTT
jgi:tetratricopeptide (TPR) repeat protein